MRKQFTIFLILIFVLGLVPVNFSEAITQNQINAEVQIVCTDGADNWFSGSGTIIDPKGIILTNRHVIEGAYKNTCFIGLLESIDQEPNFGTKDNLNLAEVKYTTTTVDMDAAVLFLDNPNNKTYPYVNIWDSNSSNLKFGDKIEVVGYPSIGGSTITFTSGDFSGFGSQSDGTKNYIKTTAALEHGNSGGSAYNQRGDFVGIPSKVVVGELNSISYILSVDSIKKWIAPLLVKNNKQEIIQNYIPSNILEEPNVSGPNISKLTSDNFYVGYFDDGNVSQNNLMPFLRGESDNLINYHSRIIIGLSNNAFCSMSKNKIVSVFYSVSKNLNKLSNENEVEKYVWGCSSDSADLVTNSIHLSEGPGLYYFSFRFKDENGIISERYILEYKFKGDKNDSYQNDFVAGSTRDPKLEKRLSGRILLQVESHGEAWYVNPKDNKRYYMANGAEAYTIMRNLGVGITNKDLEKIRSNKDIAKKQWGKIFLQTESRGEAYYIDINGVAHYLKDGNVAYQIMRELGLGITNSELNKILIGGQLIEQWKELLSINNFDTEKVSDVFYLSKKINFQYGNKIKVIYSFQPKTNVNNAFFWFALSLKEDTREEFFREAPGWIAGPIYSDGDRSSFYEEYVREKPGSIINKEKIMFAKSTFYNNYFIKLDGKINNYADFSLKVYELQ
ncbi:MAG: S1C family serine protease [Candidatus Staskawiczbacteria bacterium]|nr:S1C family serine protease [Candidatus Staskawiczbacteria bacterium]